MSTISFVISSSIILVVILAAVAFFINQNRISQQPLETQPLEPQSLAVELMPETTSTPLSEPVANGLVPTPKPSAWKGYCSKYCSTSKTKPYTLNTCTTYCTTSRCPDCSYFGPWVAENTTTASPVTPKVTTTVVPVTTTPAPVTIAASTVTTTTAAPVATTAAPNYKSFCLERILHNLLFN